MKDPVIISVDHPNYILDRMHGMAEKNAFEFSSLPEHLSRETEWDKINCRLASDDLTAWFNLQQCPGCCAVLVISYIRFDRGQWSQENFDRVLQNIEQVAYDAGFGSVMMTQTVPAYSRMFWKKEPWILCLERDWVVGDPFRNGKSGNLCVFLAKDLKQKGKVKGLEFPAPLD